MQECFQVHHLPPSLCNQNVTSAFLKKQMKTPVWKVWEEGHKVVRKLQIVCVDLAGPISVQSHTGNKYTIDIVNNYTNMFWAILLKSKLDAFAALEAWKKAWELETGMKVGIYCIGHNSKLKSYQMEA